MRRKCKIMAVPHAYFLDYYYRLVQAVEWYEGNAIKVLDANKRAVWDRISVGLWVRRYVEYAPIVRAYETLPEIRAFDKSLENPYSAEKLEIYGLQLKVWRRNPWTETPTGNHRHEASR